MITRLGFNLTVRGGRETMVRLLAIVGGVAIGVSLFLATLGWLHAIRASVSQACWWSCTKELGKHETDSLKHTVDPLIWRASTDYYQGQRIKRLEVSATGDRSPQIPGITNIPESGTYYVSPALKKLLDDPKYTLLQQRYPERYAGTIGESGLSKPDELVLVVGKPATEIRRMSSSATIYKVTNVQPIDPGSVSTKTKLIALGGLSILLFPVVALIVTVTRLSAARREERFAALRLIGATSRQINILASVEAGVGAIGGLIIGTVLFLALRPLFSSLDILQGPYFSKDFWPTASEYGLIALSVPILAISASLTSLHRVRVTPLGVSRKTNPGKPKLWGIITLAVSVLIFGTALLITHYSKDKSVLTIPILISFVGTMIGLVVSGPWITEKLSQVLATHAQKAATLLAARRLHDNPKAAFRTISGLVIVLFSGTIVAVFMGMMQTGYKTTSQDQRLNNMLFTNMSYSTPYSEKTSNEQKSTVVKGRLNSAESTALMKRLRNETQADIIPFYLNPAAELPTLGDQAPISSIASCDALRQLPKQFNDCKPGQAAQLFNAGLLQLTFETGGVIDVPFSGDTHPASQQELANAMNNELSGLIIATDGSAHQVEKVRTILAAATGTTPLTFSENQIEVKRSFTALKQFLSTAVGIMVFVSGCSLVIALAGSLMERKRAFGLLRAAGSPLSVLHRIVLLEAFLPLLGSAFLAVGLALAMAYVFFNSIQESYMPSFSMPDMTFWLTMGAGLLAAAAIIIFTLPFLGRITRPDDTRFE